MRLTRAFLSLAATLALAAGAALGQEAAAPAGPETAPAGPKGDTQLVLFSFEEDVAAWRVLKDGVLSEVECAPAKAAQGAGRSLSVPVVLPGTAGAGVAIPEGRRSWHPYTSLSLKVYLPIEAPEKVQAIVYLKDSALHYYQHFRPSYVERGAWTELNLDLTAGSLDWLPVGHYKPWDGYCRQGVSEMGVKLTSEQPFEGAFLVDDVVLHRDPAAEPSRSVICNMRPSSLTVGRYNKFEVSFDLAKTYSNPFDPEVVAVSGRFVQPDGSSVSVPGFFYQGYLRTMERGRERLVPAGRSQWKVRFAPQQVGTYHYYVQVDDGERIRSPLATFRCVQSDNHGFVRLCATDPQYFEFSDGTFYYPIGHNLAAVHDERARALGVSIPAEEGTFAYDRFLSRMGASGENFARVWMSPWNLGIEWTKAYDRHYEGLGRYNLYNAWRLDHVVEEAADSGVYLMLLLTGHGELGDVEQDFFGHDPAQTQGSPYWDRYGGPLKTPLDLYDSPEGIKFYERKVRYIAARWGYATSVMAWEILNEADLGFRRSRDPVAVARRAGQFLRQVVGHLRENDPSRRLVTSSLLYDRAPYAGHVFSLPELDFIASHTFSDDLAGQLAADRRHMQEQFGKVMFVTEAGLTAFAQDPALTHRAMHATLWSSHMLPLPGTACPWWWVLIDRKDLYPEFAAVAAFARGEDRRGAGFQQAAAAVQDAAGKRQLQAWCLRNDTRAFCWVYNPTAFTREAEWTAEASAGATVSIAGMADGRYAVQVWDTTQGTVTGTLDAACQGGQLAFTLPPFQRDVAFKVIRQP